MKWILWALGAALPYVVSEDGLPFVLTLCATSTAPADSLCADGFTFIMPASEAATKRLSGIAPSQYQANWHRTGGVVDGGPAVNLLMNTLMPLLNDAMPEMDSSKCLPNYLSGFHTPEHPLYAEPPYAAECVYLPPVPSDFVSGLAIAQNQTRLPMVASPLTARELQEYPYPVWQIYRASWERRLGFSPSSLVQALAMALGATETLGTTATSVVGLRLFGFPGETAQLEFVTMDEVKALPEVMLTRRVKMSGLTFRMDTRITLPEPPAAALVDAGCQVVVDQFLPASIFIDQDEAQAHTRQRESTRHVAGRHGPGRQETGRLAWVFPQFHDIELPAHLATPVVYRTTHLLLTGERNYGDQGPTFHDRYLLDAPKNAFAQKGSESERGRIYLEPPAIAIQCPGSAPPALQKVTEAHIYPRSTRYHPNAAIVQGVSITPEFLPYVVALTTTGLLTALIVVAKPLLQCTLRLRIKQL
ncbi:putative transmembrane protein [Gregarina niphandrodes]|uniref:Transmembrane protein n=1 Tax=Gregarina niphandrodes TaxID=110365 RepID=A0A023B1F6_GRENI|nr:putative transmembrane protein [Gregarina niphandrodes]EZG46735.1 putative transmembrane protein [Gregarina niphandrodes]|eukprot:XP_011132244.1 putative transmembrane protein [Gregarina niphandrodes]